MDRSKKEARLQHSEAVDAEVEFLLCSWLVSKHWLLLRSVP